MNETELKFGIDIKKNDKDMWCVGISLNHWYNETYICVGFFRYVISIGRIRKY